LRANDVENLSGLSKTCVAQPDIVAYYESKTRALLERYGPGPRVHYHVGLVDPEDLLNISAEPLRERLVASQERLLRYAAEVWHVRNAAFEDVLDVGCGLGGGAIFWAQEFGARVTAITIARSHLDYVATFAEQAGVRSLVQPLLCDALEVPGKECFDAAVAIDSSSSFSRWAWFPRLVDVLRPGGSVFIADCFLEKNGYRNRFNHHWCAQIGSIGEYIAAAQSAGMRCELTDDISGRTVHFWSITLELMEREITTKRLGNAEILKIQKSIAVHKMLRRGLIDGGLRYALMSFSKPF
jgi:cyclopropane fatty-acyl-phospholipid synthase-like methyltransferase